MKYYIAAEGGGTKLLTVLYDDDLHVIRTACTAGTNDGYRKTSDIRASMETLAEELFSGTEAAGIDSIERLDMALVGSGHVFRDVFEHHLPVQICKIHGEGQVALAAAGLTEGLVAQSGTGSDAFLIRSSGNETVGGWGPLLGDEGSGYHIGLMGLKAAIYAFDGRGRDTCLLPMVMEAYGLDHLWGLVRVTIDSPDIRRTVGSAALLVAKAAAAGDRVALEIYDRAAEDMATQVLTVLKRVGGVLDVPIVASGGGWKGHPRMFDTFCRLIREAYPHAEIVHPVFEPVVGCVFLRLLEEGMTEKDALDNLKTRFCGLFTPQYRQSMERKNSI